MLWVWLKRQWNLGVSGNFHPSLTQTYSGMRICQRKTKSSILFKIKIFLVCVVSWKWCNWRQSWFLWKCFKGENKNIDIKQLFYPHGTILVSSWWLDLWVHVGLAGFWIWILIEPSSQLPFLCGEWTWILIKTWFAVHVSLSPSSPHVYRNLVWSAYGSSSPSSSLDSSSPSSRPLPTSSSTFLDFLSLLFPTFFGTTFVDFLLSDLFLWELSLWFSLIELVFRCLLSSLLLEDLLSFFDASLLSICSRESLGTDLSLPWCLALCSSFTLWLLELDLYSPSCLWSCLVFSRDRLLCPCSLGSLL